MTDSAGLGSPTARTTESTEDHLVAVPDTPELSAQIAELSSGTAEILPADGLADKLRAAAAQARPLRVKLGIDPSGTELTLGHAVVLRKLRQFQDFGHKAVLIVGDFTGRVGDPTGRNETRKVLTAEDTQNNSATYLDQVMSILRDEPELLEVRRNSEWLNEMTFGDVLGYSRLMTVARLLERDDFNKRYNSGQPISLMEFMYPMMQGLDSVFIESDIELGGTDQTYNNLVGRTLQSQLGQQGQVVITLPLLRGTDGAEKMGKSLSNWIGIEEPPNEQFGKVVSISDDLVQHYAELCCAWPVAAIEASNALLQQDPFAAKRAVAARIVELYHGPEAATEASQWFDKKFRHRELVEENLNEFGLAEEEQLSLIQLLVDTALCSSKGEAKRMVQSGAIRLNGDKVAAGTDMVITTALRGAVLQRGKLQAVKLR